MKSTFRHATRALVGVAAAVTLAACGSSDHAGTDHDDMPGAAGSPSVTAPAASADHNAADVSFATDMIPHHQQAVEMADLAAERASNAQVKALAAEIKAAQDPEIRTMSGWLAQWGQPVPTDTDGHDMSDMDHGDGATMEGMMTDEEMEQLASASGAEFDRLWLEMMIKHHEGAVSMATTATTAGKSAETKALAQEIIAAQQAEITQMEQLLPSITG
ncbi:DUF305 domain-containing protein [Humibacillus xanthopallidus]|uniref:DUF305 domain-containing protein n=1 Tax=Humibacillus xanthopallidus TaxID=412689 RepID=UPI00384C12A0